MTKQDLAKIVTQTTVETYEELAPQLIMLLEETKKNDTLSDMEKSDEIMLNMMGYVKSCTNQIIIEVLANILGLEEDEEDHSHCGEDCSCGHSHH
ncbi:MAG: hypothetical protein ACLRZ7_03485 [Lachnospiraceae bacterium]